MKVTILGNNSALPAFGRHPTSQVVSLYGQDILIDCGEGTQIQMQKWGIRWRHIDHIYISHLHGDHYFGIFGLLTTMSLLGRAAPLHLYAPAPLEKLIADLLAIAASVLSYPFHFLRASGGRSYHHRSQTFYGRMFPYRAPHCLPRLCDNKEDARQKADT